MTDLADPRDRHPFEEATALHEVAEAVLANVSDSKVVRTYRQTDYLEQRRDLLERWGHLCTSTPE